MQVSKWGNSLAVRLPAAVVQALDLKEGEEIELHVVSSRSLEVARKTLPQELLTRLRRLRGRLPADFHFDRLDANERNTDAGQVTHEWCFPRHQHCALPAVCRCAQG